MQIAIFIATQTLDLLDEAGTLVRRYPISSAEKGCGERKGSYQTPRGRHVIRACIGGGQPLRTVFRARRPTGEIHDEALHAAFPARDWILTRILWLSGCEPGFNRLGVVDTMQRYIYIHGTPDNVVFGPPSSHGCIRMHNEDVADLFDRVRPGTPVVIHADGFNGPAPAPVDRCSEVSWHAMSPALTRLRHEVFVAEQGVPVELEIDDLDPLSRHWQVLAPSGQLIATGRLTPDGHIGRLAVVRAWRGRGVGTRLLQALVAAARASGADHVALNAQIAALPFYTRAGFRPTGGIFDDAGIPHQAMILELH